MKRPLTIIIVILVLAAVVYLLMPRPPVIDVANVVRGDLDAELSTTGVVESDLSDIAPKIVSPVAKLLAQEGQTVRQGQVLALLDRSELLARVDEARATLSTAQEDLGRAEQAVAVQSKQSSASIARATAAVRAAQARFADLEKGARPQEIEQARNAVEQAESEADQARADLKRAERLYERGAIPAQELDVAKTAAKVADARLRASEEQLDLLKAGPRIDEIKAARAEVAAAKAALAEARTSADMVVIKRREASAARSQVERAQAAVQAVKAQLDYAVIRSPFAGVVARKHLEEGEVAGPQSPVYTLANLEHTWVIAEVDEEDLSALALGQSVEITTAAYPGRKVRGSVVRISPIAEPKAVGRVRAKIVRAKIEIRSSELPLKPGMEVDITGRVPVGKNLILVPNDALIQIGNRYRAFVVRGRRVHPRFVTTGLSNYDFTEIVRGIKPGDLVATSMLDQLQPGQRVRVRRQAGDTD